MTRTCKYEPCSKEFAPTHWRQEFCEPKCRNDHFYAANPEKRAPSPKRALPCVAEHPLQEVRDQQATKKHNRDLGGLIRKAILERLRTVGECHCDDLIPFYPTGEVDECRRLATAQFGSLASAPEDKEPLIREVRREKSTIPSRKGSKVTVWEFTKAGWDMYGTAGVSSNEKQGEGKAGSHDAGALDRPGPSEGRESSGAPTLAADSGEAPSEGVPPAAPADPTEPARLFGDESAAARHMRDDLAA